MKWNLCLLMTPMRWQKAFGVCFATKLELNSSVELALKKLKNFPMNDGPERSSSDAGRLPE